MKFLIQFTLHEEKRHETLAMFAQMPADQEQAMMGDHLKLIGRWHDLASGTGVAIMEADTAEAIAAYALAWNRSMDIEVSPVVDDEGAKAIGKQMVAGS